MGNNRFAHQQNKGFKTPQEGPVIRQASTPAQMRAGRAPEVSHQGFPGMTKIASGTAPKDVGTGVGSNTRPESRVRSGTDPDLGKFNTKGSVPSQVKGGSAPSGGNTPPGAGRSSADKDNQRAQIGRNGYAMGGKVNRHGVEKLSREEKRESPAERAREEKDKALEAKEGDKYAKGGKVLAAGGNGGLTGGNAAIPLAQPGGVPSTGISAGGTLPMSSDTLGTESRVAPPKLRTAALKRSGAMPSLPRPRR